MFVQTSALGALSIAGVGARSLSLLGPFEPENKMLAVPACTGTAGVGPLAPAPAVGQFGDTGATPGSGNYYSAWKYIGYELLLKEKNQLCEMVEKG